ncbi:MAG TPA: response regulator, partial [Desulfobulbus sp.]|nr:response regulator [Desulfobulbus sp.]
VRVVDVELSGQGEAADVDLPPGGYVLLSVADTGIGMDEATRARIFDPYFTTKETGEGTGLGLAVVHGIVQSYGGAIRVTSRPGYGSLFEVFLPRLDADQGEEQEKGAGPEYVGGRERIMFVDDEELIVNMSRQLLGRFGYTVLPFTSSREALAHFREHAGEIDLVITDLTMPEMSGVELARRMMAIRPELPVILCTGYSEEMNREQVLALGIARFVQKPLVMEEMLQTVRSVLDG